MTPNHWNYEQQAREARERQRSELKPASLERELVEALRQLVKDGECYCADNVAAKGPCGYCEASAVLGKYDEAQAKHPPTRAPD